MTSYNPWPIGKLPENWIRAELRWAKERGIYKDDAREIVEVFEQKMANYAGAKYALAVDCCSHGIFLSLKYLMNRGEIAPNLIVNIPEHTYASVPMQILHAGLEVSFNESEWSGVYQLLGTRVVDSAGRFTKGMYLGQNVLQVLSFQIKKTLPIGKGGMILMDDKEAYDWIKRARHDGRDLSTQYDSKEHISSIGWHYYMTPEDAARGLYIFEQLPMENPDCMSFKNYPSLKDWKCW